MNAIGPQLDRLKFFQAELGLTEEDLTAVAPYRSVFLPHRDAFADYIHDLLSEIPETRRIVDLMEARGGLRRNWRCWFEGFFTEGLSRRFYDFLWTSGLKHVTRNVDQRFIHLGYCMARLFMADIIEREIPLGDQHKVRSVVDKMIDQCLLVAADAFLTSTTQCDREVINGIAHQVRNPLTVIGGFIHNLQRRVPAGSPLQPTFDIMLQETRRLEAMVADVGDYIEIMERQTTFEPCSLRAILDSALARLRQEGWAAEVDFPNGEALEQRLDSDPQLLGVLFYQLLQNGLEAAQETERPVTRVAVRTEGSPPSALSVEIFNNGRVPDPEEVVHLFTPFYSSKTAGSGFGLPLASLIVRKTGGELDLEPLAGEGTRVTVRLPLRPSPSP